MDVLALRSFREACRLGSISAAGFGVTLVPALLVPALRTDLVIRPLVAAPRRSLYAAFTNPGEPVSTFVAALRSTPVPDLL